MTSAATTTPATSDRRVSEDLGLWEPKRTLTLEAARIHTRRIKLLRYVLMAVSVILVGVLVWQFLSDRGGFDVVNDPTESVKMVEPRYSGRTSDGLPFYLIADTAVRRMKSKNTVILENPILKYNREDGVASSSVISKDGTYNDVEKILVLRNEVDFESDDGKTCQSNHARIYNVEKRIEGDEAIECFGDFGQVNGNRYNIEDSYGTFIFKDGMRAVLTESDVSAESDSAFGFGGDGPINVTAKIGIYKGAQTDLRGDVVVIQDGALMSSDQMDVLRLRKTNESGQADGSLGAIQNIVATGNFHYKSDKHDIRGTKGVYQRDKNLMTVTGDVVVLEPNGKTIEAQVLNYDTKTGTIRLSGNEGGRVGIRIPGSKG